MGPPTAQLRGGNYPCWANLMLSEETEGIVESLFAVASFLEHVSINISRRPGSSELCQDYLSERTRHIVWCTCIHTDQISAWNCARVPNVKLPYRQMFKYQSRPTRNREAVFLDRTSPERGAAVRVDLKCDKEAVAGRSRAKAFKKASTV